MISLDTLTQQVTDVLAYSQDRAKSEFGAVDKLIAQWWESKQRFLPILDDNLIWEGPSVFLYYTPEIRKSMFEQFFNRALDYLETHECSDEGQIGEFEEWLHDNAEGFFDNVVQSPLPCSEMKPGMKLIKAFKFFDFEQDNLRYIQDLASQFIQKQKIEGTLCVSIHPLDYLSISDNRANWRSCHALDGEYRAGNLSYMLDKTTVVCYIKSKEDVQLERFPSNIPWNNKKWRVLLHIHEHYHIAYVNRQYPFSSNDLIYRLMETAPLIRMGFDYKPAYEPDEGFRNLGDRDFSQNYFRLRGFILDPAEVCAGDKNSLQYNDFVHSPHYTPQYILPRNRLYSFFGATGDGLRSEYTVPIGVSVPCPCCGVNNLDDSCNFLCEDCYDENSGVIGTCDKCGARIYEGDSFYEDEEGHIYCEECMELVND